MPYTFPLEAVLRVRQHRETAQERVLAELSQSLQQTRATLARVQAQLRQWTEERGQEAGTASPGSAQHARYARLSFLHSTEKELEAQAADLQRRLAEQIAVYTAARRERETLTEMKEKQKQDWREAEARREQRRIEDLVLARWSR